MYFQVQGTPSQRELEWECGAGAEYPVSGLLKSFQRTVCLST